jgi:hypothetical protein
MSNTNKLNDIKDDELKEVMKGYAVDWTGYRFGDGFVDPHWDDWNTGD